MSQKSVDDMKLRLISRIEHKDGNGCWNTKNLKHRGTFSFKGKAIPISRASYILFKGNLEEGLIVCHRCNNEFCVNPDHLYAGTYEDNSRDTILSGHHHQKKKTSCRNGHPYTEKNMYLYYYEKTNSTYRRCHPCDRAHAKKWKDKVRKIAFLALVIVCVVPGVGWAEECPKAYFGKDQYKYADAYQFCRIANALETIAAHLKEGK